MLISALEGLYCRAGNFFVDPLRVYVQHRGAGARVRHLRSLGLEAYPAESLVPANPNQPAFF